MVRHLIPAGFLGQHPLSWRPGPRVRRRMEDAEVEKPRTDTCPRQGYHVPAWTEFDSCPSVRGYYGT